MPPPPWTPQLLVFDVFGTLVLPKLGHESTFADGLRSYGVEPTAQLMQALQRCSERIGHARHSASRDTYVKWTRNVLDAISTAGITSETEAYVIPALEQHHQAPMWPEDGVTSLLSALRSRGFIIAVCSNWSWDLSADLQHCGLRDMIDLVFSSAVIGFRKPHPEIYRRVLGESAVTPRDAIFIGDSLTTDVEGPMSIGIPAIHLVKSSRPSRARWQMDDIRSLWQFLAQPE